MRSSPEASTRPRLLLRGLRLEYVTLGWNVVGVVILTAAAIATSSVALASFGLDSLIEIAASIVVVWELTGTGAGRERLALRLIGWAFFAIAIYIALHASYLLAAGDHAKASYTGIAWTGLTFIAMLALANGRALDNPVLRTEGRVTLVDAYLAAAELLGLALNAALGWWWAQKCEFRFAMFRFPVDVAVGPDGTCYVADSGDHLHPPAVPRRRPRHRQGDRQLPGRRAVAARSSRHLGVRGEGCHHRPRSVTPSWAADIGCRPHRPPATVCPGSVESGRKATPIWPWRR